MDRRLQHKVLAAPVPAPESWRSIEAPIRGVWGGATREVQGQNPWSEGQGGFPLKLKHFWLLDVQ